MKRKMFKQWVGLVLVLMMVGAVVGCAQKAPVAEPTPTEQSTQTEATSETQPTQEATNTDSAFPITITDSTGTEITINQKPEKIVSLAPSTTEILYFLGVEDHIVGRTDFCTFPESISSVASVGGTSDPNIEAIVALSPDLVVASTHVSEEVLTKLREVGINVAFLNEQENFEGTYSAIQNIGKLVGESAKADEVVAQMKEKVEATIEKVKVASEGKAVPKVYYTIGFGEGDYSAGGDTFIGEMITLAGGDNIAKDLKGWGISKEQIAAGDPDLIIMPSNRNMPEDMKKTDFYKDLRAVKEGKLYEISEDMISRQGPRLADAFVELAQIINP
ncbi:MAG: ABC transporter substrate-binding protein, partial [Cellulosilyticaceae bacterium]